MTLKDKIRKRRENKREIKAFLKNNRKVTLERMSYLKIPSILLVEKTA